MFGGRLIKTLLISVGGLMAACMADNPSAVEKETELEMQKADARVVVSLAAVQPQVIADDSVELIFSIENFTEKNFRVLPWGTPLEAVLSADIFDVITGNEILPYRGRVIKRAPPGEADYVDLAAGEKKQVTVNLSQAYDTRIAGTYQIQLKTVDGEYQMRDHSVKIVTDPVVIERL